MQLQIYLEEFCTLDSYLNAVQSKYDLISLADKNDMYVINILINRAVQEFQIPDLLKRYSINEQAPIFIYFWYKGKWSYYYYKDRTTNRYEIYYEKWMQFFWRLFEDSYANPKYLWDRNIYYNEMFVLAELADFIRSKKQPEFCQFEHGTKCEPIKIFNPNSSRNVEDYQPRMMRTVN